MPYTLTFLKGDPLSTTLTQPDGTPVYKVETPRRLLGNHITSVQRIESGGDALVAAIEWKYPHEEEMTVALYGGEAHNIGKFMIQKILFAVERYVKLEDGTEYEWVEYHTLRDLNGKIRARYTPAGMEFRKLRWRNAVLEIWLDDVFTDRASFCRAVDKIVVSLLILEAWRRRKARYMAATEIVES